MKEYFWEPQQLFDAETEFVLIVLNTKILDELRLIQLWNKAKFRVTVDGGTNRWHQIVLKHSSQIEEKFPDLITGDLDSIEEEILSIYSKKSQVIKTPDQNFTDFTKALFEIQKIDHLKTYNILSFAEHSGRLDQIFGIFETLYHIEDTKLFVTSSTSIEWLLKPGKHSILLPEGEKKSQLHCGIIPLGNPCPGVETSGFKWNLDGKTLLAFGHLVSTSNKFDNKAKLATVSTSNPLLFTMELRLEDK